MITLHDSHLCNGLICNTNACVKSLAVADLGGGGGGGEGGGGAKTPCLGGKNGFSKKKTQKDKKSKQKTKKTGGRTSTK